MPPAAREGSDINSTPAVATMMASATIGVGVSCRKAIEKIAISTGSVFV